MSSAVGIIAGAVFGLFFFGAMFAQGPLSGALLGATLGWCLSLHQRVDALTSTLSRLSRDLQRGAASGLAGDAKSASPDPRQPPTRDARPLQPPTETASVNRVGTGELSDDTFESPATPESHGAAQIPLQPGTSGVPGTARESDRQFPAASSRAAYESGSAIGAGVGRRQSIDSDTTTRPDQPRRTSSVFELVRRWFTTGNVPVKVGVVLSVVGLSFLLKEAVDRSWLVLPIELRLAGVALFGVAMLAIGWRLEQRRPGYALSLQGGGIAVVYLTVYTAFGIYGVLAAPLAFLLMVITTLTAGFIAVSQNSRALAILGIVGGFMAPVLASDGGGNHVILFSYYAFLNAAIFGIAWFKAWRELNLLGFAFTFIIGSIWGYQAYEPQHFASTEPFLVLFFLMYVAIPILFASKVPTRIRGFVDGTLVFGAPLTAFVLQYALVRDFADGPAWTAAIVATFYAALAGALLLRGPAWLRVLGEAFAGLSMTFIAITVPLALDAQATSVAWAVQGVATCWLGIRQERRVPLVAGVLLQALAAVVYLAEGATAAGLTPVLNGPYFGALVISIAAFVTARLFDRPTDRPVVDYGAQVAGAMLLWGTVWWLGAGFNEIERTVTGWQQQLNAMAALGAGTVLLASVIGRRLPWERLGSLGALLIPLLPATLAIASLSRGPVHEGLGWLAWMTLATAHFVFLGSFGARFARLGSLLHPLGYVCLLLAAASELWYYLDVRFALPGIWPTAIMLPLLAAAALYTVRFVNYMPHFIASMQRSYAVIGAGTIALLTACWTLVTNAVSNGGAGSLPYVPLLNPLETASVLTGIGLALYVRELRQVGLLDARPQALATAGVASALYLLTMAVARGVHQFAGVPFDAGALASSEVFQAALSMTWGAAGLACMLTGAHRAHRAVWLAGAALMGIVVGKLFLIDLANTGTVERVISFLGVGILLLIVGYFAPVPPRGEIEPAKA